MTRRSLFGWLAGLVAGLCFWRKAEAMPPLKYHYARVRFSLRCHKCQQREAVGKFWPPFMLGVSCHPDWTSFLPPWRLCGPCSRGYQTFEEHQEAQREAYARLERSCPTCYEETCVCEAVREYR